MLGTYGIVMTELQKLFATLILTQKAVADPTDVIKALLTGAKSSIQFGHQEDVHEINLLILDTIEEAYTFNQQGNMVKEYFPCVHTLTHHALDVSMVISLKSYSCPVT